jgi:hypothetical protein
MVILGKPATGEILDKVIIDERKMIDCSPTNAAITSFIDLDFECPPSPNNSRLPNRDNRVHRTSIPPGLGFLGSDNR